MPAFLANDALRLHGSHVHLTRLTVRRWSFIINGGYAPRGRRSRRINPCCYRHRSGKSMAERLYLTETPLAAFTRLGAPVAEAVNFSSFSGRSISRVGLGSTHKWLQPRRLCPPTSFPCKYNLNGRL